MNLSNPRTIYTPFDYQLECLTAIELARLADAQAALAVMAAGLGKTITVAFDIGHWLQQRGGRVLYLCNQNDILDQAQKKINDVLGQGVTHGFYYGHKKSPYKADCLYASLQTLARHHTLFQPQEFSYIVVDETHHIPAPTYEKVLRYFRPQFLLGVTATPDRMDGLDVRKIFGEEVYNLPLEDALARNLLTPVDYRLLTNEVDISRTQGLMLQPNVTVSALDDQLFVPRTDEEVASTIRQHASEVSSPRIIVFAGTIPHAERMALVIPNSVSYHSGISKNDRKKRLERFRAGLVETIITVDCFNEGIDVPEANIIVFLRSTSSLNVFLQQLGRGLRKSPGKNKVIVLDFVGNCDRIARVKELADAVNQRQKHDEDIPRLADAGVQFNFDATATELLQVIKNARPPRIADYPDLASEYSQRNSETATQASIKTQGKVWWTCPMCKDDYQMTIREKRLGHGCSKCAEIATESNNLEKMYPELAREYGKENSLPANQIRATSKEFVRWVCSDCQYQWMGSPYSRLMRGDSCPSCAQSERNFRNNFAFHYPELLVEYAYFNWSSPEKLSMRSNKYRSWVCRMCKTVWKTNIHSRIMGTSNCPNNCSALDIETQTIEIAHPVLATRYSAGNVRPVSEITVSSGEVVRWLCEECGRYSRSTTRQMLGGLGCLHCHPVSAEASLGLLIV